MSDKLLEEAIKKIILSRATEIFAINVFSDEITIYEVFDSNLRVRKKDALTSYLESCKNNIPASYLRGYMGMFSIPRLEEEQLNDKDKIEFKYQSLNGKWYKITSMLFELSGSKMIFAINEEITNGNDALVGQNNDKYNKLITNLSDAILKIYNVFDVDAKRLNNLKSVEDYVNAVLSQLTTSYPELKKSLKKNAASVSSMAYESILIVDDDMVTRNMIKKVFEDEYKIIMAANGKEAIEYLEANESKEITESADNVLGIFLDLTMPVMDGFAVLEYLSRNNYLSKIPVIIISGDYEKETKARVYNYNIADMLEKPFDFQVVKHRISNFINLYKSSNSLGELISDQNVELKNLINPFVEAYKYDYKNSINNVNRYIKILGKQVMDDYPEFGLVDESVEKMASASRYYDIGFYSIPRSVLNKRGTLDKKEIDRIKDYPVFGSKLIKYVLSLISDIKYKTYATNIAKYYHENYDGSGYPSHLSGDRIPLESQLASIAITYNNLLKKEVDPRDYIISKSGKNFNPKIVESFTKVANQFSKVK